MRKRGRSRKAKAVASAGIAAAVLATGGVVTAYATSRTPPGRPRPRRLSPAEPLLLTRSQSARHPSARSWSSPQSAAAPPLELTPGATPRSTPALRFPSCAALIVGVVRLMLWPIGDWYLRKIEKQPNEVQTI